MNNKGLVNTMVRNKFKKISIAGLILWLCYGLYDLTYNSEKYQKYVSNGHSGNERNKQSADFLIEKVFKDESKKEIKQLDENLMNEKLIFNAKDSNKIDNDKVKSNEKNFIINKIMPDNLPFSKPQILNINNPNNVISFLNSNQNQNNVINSNANFLNNDNNNAAVNSQQKGKEAILKNLERVVHIDLKGAIPKVDYIEKFISMVKDFGATGILLEYEDTFPYEGKLAEAKHGHAYTLDEVNKIKEIAKKNGLYLIPLIQTYGHLEWLLKIKSFAHLRDAEQFPQVITPCLQESYDVLYDMIDQVIKVHDDAPYFHLGCDEVYYKLAHEKCRTAFPNNDFTSAFMNHLIKVATHVRQKLPKAKIMFWDDMMHGMPEQNIIGFKPKIEELELIPMMWGYMEDVKSYFQPDLYVKYGRVFGKIWIATAYKGASGELATLTSIQHHYLNHLSWIDVMYEKVSNNILNFTGVAITGWSRYDHFLQLCDLLPVSIPSLVYNLQAIQYGPLSEAQKSLIAKKLGCNGQIPWSGEYSSYQSLTCTFPGHEVYEAILPLSNVINNAKPNYEFAQKYMTPLHLEYNYIHKQRAMEVTEKLRYNYQSMISFKDKFIQACSVMYHDDTAIEWLTVYFIPELDKIFYILSRIKNFTNNNDWKPRPLPVTLRQYPQNL